MISVRTLIGMFKTLPGVGANASSKSTWSWLILFVLGLRSTFQHCQLLAVDADDRAYHGPQTRRIRSYHW